MKINAVILATLLSSFLLLLVGCSSGQKVDGFQGVFTTDTFPVHGYRIVEAGGTISNASRFYISQKDDLEGEKGNFLGTLSDSMLNGVRKGLIEQAKSEGYDAIVGYRVTVAQTFDGFGGSVVNGSLGIGYAVVMAEGVPVKLRKF